MLIRFSSKAGADVLMLESHARAVLQALGRTPASEGIFLPEQIPTALACLDRALGEGAAAPESRPAPEAAGDQALEEAAPQLRQRAWPVRALMQRAWETDRSVQWQPL